MVGRIIFNIKFFDAERGAETMGAHQRREAGVEADARFAVDGQELAIAPQVMWPGGDLSPADGFCDRVVVVANVEGANTVVADVIGLIGILLLALAALQALDQAHVNDFLNC